MLAAATWLVDALKKLKLPVALFGKSGLPMLDVRRDVHWKTLTAFVKEQVRQGSPLPLETLGATVGKVVKIKERK
jgi:hypothetical protein